MATATSSLHASEIVIKNRKHATRTCLSCRKDKRRCQLGSIFISSSLSPLKTEDACERCKKMNLHCIVWDGNRKTSKKNTFQPITHNVKDSRTTKRSTMTFASSTEEERILRPFYPYAAAFKTTVQEIRASSDATYARDKSCIGRLCYTSDEDFDEKAKLISKLRRPMEMMVQMLVKQGQFRFGIPQYPLQILRDAEEEERNLLSALLDDDHEINSLSLIVQHPHLPTLHHLISSNRSQPNPSNTLLLYTITFLCRVWEARKLSPDMSKMIAARIVDRVNHLSLHIVQLAPCKMEAAQALELLAVHAPFLLCKSLSDSYQSSRTFASDGDNSAPGSGLIAVAIKIAVNLGCDASRGLEIPNSSTESILWKSLCCWELALSFHDPHPVIPKSGVSMNMAIREDLYPNYDVCRSESRIRAVGIAFLNLRCSAMVGTARCDLERVRIINEAKSNQEVKDAQTKLFTRYREEIEHQKAERCRYWNKIKSDLLSLNFADENRRSRIDFVLSLTRKEWLLLDLESIGMYQNLLTKAMGDLHFKFLRERREELKLTAQTEWISEQQIWEHSIWSEHVALLGKWRDKATVSYISNFCRLKAAMTDIRCSNREVLRMPLDHTRSYCQLFAMPILSAMIVHASKSLLDSQSVLIQFWNHIYEDLEMYIIAIQQAAEILRDNIDIVIYDPMDNGIEPGIGHCCADILDIIADTLSRWHERQQIDLAKCHEAQSKRQTEDENQNSQAQITPASSTILREFSENNMLVAEADRIYNKDLVVEDDCSMTASSGVYQLDAISSMHSFHNDFLSMPDWPDFVLSGVQENNEE